MYRRMLEGEGEGRGEEKGGAKGRPGVNIWLF
jgi:hypothetical protein